MNSTTKYSLLFLAGLLAVPAFVLLHEVRHYIAQTSLGAHSTIHYDITTGTMPKEKATPARAALQMAAAPLGDAVFAIAGFLWLYKLRKDRRETAPTVLDWCATILALNALRWVRGFAWSPSHPQPGDEAFISQYLGLPGWGLPYLLALLCLIPLAATIRLHPPGARLIPFGSYVLGASVGCLVWFTLLGPVLLP